MNSITRDATDMYSLFNASDGYPGMGIPRRVMITVSTVTYEAQHYAYDHDASFCSYIKQHTAFIYRRICKMKYC